MGIQVVYNLGNAQGRTLTSWKNFSVTRAFRGAVYHAACVSCKMMKLTRRVWERSQEKVKNRDGSSSSGAFIGGGGHVALGTIREKVCTRRVASSRRGGDPPGWSGSFGNADCACREIRAYVRLLSQ